MTETTPRPAPGRILEGPLFSERMRIETAEANGAAGWTLAVLAMTA
ncbi:MAG: hypothetical protein M0002_00575 [Rhodospirillales bacterium]|nr:hypothetical protein [Rhodospirillales bacterium]